jgi:hypothetical protein
MPTLKGWDARRSGAGIRVTGKDANGNDTKIQAVSIGPRMHGAKIVAVDKDGDEHELVA